MTLIDTAAAPSAPAPPARRRVRRIAVVLVCLGFALMWGYVLFVAPWQDPVDTLDDQEWVTAAEARCARMLDELDDTVTPSQSRAERADQIDRSTATLRDLVADLRATRITDPDDRRRLDAWFADWDTYLDARDAYADRLRVDADAEFLIAHRDETQITDVMDTLALNSGMDSCETPGDV